MPSPATNKPLLILTALKDELDGFLKICRVDKKSTHLKRPWFHTRISHTAVVAGTTGVGLENARATARWAIQNFHPRVVLLAGYAGGLVTQIKSGDFVVEDSELGKLLPQPTHVGKISCVTQVLQTREQKSAHAAESGALACEMESLAVEHAAREAGLPFHHLRIISDALDEDFPLAPIVKIIDFETGHLTPLRATWHLITHPKDLGILIKLSFHIRPIRQRLGQGIAAVAAKI